MVRLPVERFSIPQLVALNDVSERSLLPSFLYLTFPEGISRRVARSPLEIAADRVLGTFARDHGAKVPGRLVGSAKSWLSHQGVDRRSPILPWSAPEDVPRISPVDASSAFLEHLRDAWNARKAGKAAAERLENQDIFLTVPASFDPVAARAHHRGGHQGWPQECHVARRAPGRLLRLARLPGPKVAQEGEGRRHHPGLRRRRRNDRLHVDRRQGRSRATWSSPGWPSASTSSWAATTWTWLWPTPSPPRCPEAWKGSTQPSASACSTPAGGPRKSLFSDPKKNAAAVNVLGRGSKVVGGSVKTELTRDMLKTVLLDGFLPACGPGDLPARGRRTGLTEIGLPYAADAAVTRHLARFLGQQAGSLHSGGQLVLPSAVLFNGGVFKAQELRRQILDVLSSWAGRRVPELESSDLDLAVADGAAYYGQVRRGRGVRIRGGVSRSYYVGLEIAAPAVPGVAAADQGACASSRWAWRKAPKPTFPAPRSA